MTPSKLELSDHAADRLKLRQITRKQVRDCIYSGTLSGTDLKGRRVKRKKFGKRLLEVVYIEILAGYLVITAYWRGIHES